MSALGPVDPHCKLCGESWDVHTVDFMPPPPDERRQEGVFDVPFKGLYCPLQPVSLEGS